MTLDQLFARLKLLVSRAVIRRVDNTGRIMQVQADGHDGETLDEIEVFDAYGLMSHPHDGAEAIVISVGSDRAHLVQVASVDRRYTLKETLPGEVALYDDLGQVVHLTRSGIVIESNLQVLVRSPEVRVEANSVVIDADETEITGNLKVGQDLLVEGEIDLGGTGGKKIAVHDDPVVAGKVVASTTKARSK